MVYLSSMRACAGECVLPVPVSSVPLHASFLK